MPAWRLFVGARVTASVGRQLEHAATACVKGGAAGGSVAAGAKRKPVRNREIVYGNTIERAGQCLVLVFCFFRCEHVEGKE
mmetsp:Transcript_4938/g.12540  ORF Transcript_4938/g.12540 Transcript_4938/m.12540 type:complete len:81 (+) Transcript_4938:248-490(+)